MKEVNRDIQKNSGNRWGGRNIFKLVNRATYTRYGAVLVLG